MYLILNEAPNHFCMPLAFSLSNSHRVDLWFYRENPFENQVSRSWNTFVELILNII